MSDWDARFLSWAAHIAQSSKDPSTKCGALIVRHDGTIASLGYNGFPQGIRDDPMLLENREEKYKRIIHAEMNAILFLQEPVNDDYTLYTWPFLPCCRCATHVIQKGIGRVVAPGGDGLLWSRHDVPLSRALFDEAGILVEEIGNAQDFGWTTDGEFRCSLHGRRGSTTPKDR